MTPDQIAAMSDRPPVTALTWQPGGANGNDKQEFLDGDQYLFAIQIQDRFRPGKWEWIYYVVTASGDSETPATFKDGSGETWDDWTWEDVEWFVALSQETRKASKVAA